MDESQRVGNFEKIAALFDDDDALRNSIADVYKVVRRVFKDVILNYDTVQIELHNRNLERDLLRYFQNAYLDGKCQLPESQMYLKRHIENFADQFKKSNLGQENYMFLSAGITLGVSNLIRELCELKPRGIEKSF